MDDGPSGWATARHQRRICGTTLSGNPVDRRCHSRGAGDPKPSHRRGRSTPLGGYAPQESASEAGGRVGVGPGLPRRPPSSESHRWRPLLVPPRSREPYPVLPALNLTACVGVPRPKAALERFVRSGSLVVADGLVGRWGVAGQACLELAQLLQHRLEVADAGGDQPAHVGPPRSSPPCPGAGCRSG